MASTTYFIDKVDGQKITDGNGAILYDSGGPSSSYGNEESHAVILAPDNGFASCRVTFQLSDPGDFIRIYEGEDTSGELLVEIGGKADGELEIPPGKLARGSIYVQWMSDKEGTAPGFSVAWIGNQGDDDRDAPPSGIMTLDASAPSVNDGGTSDVILSWTHANESEDVTGYNIYRDGSLIHTTSAGYESSGTWTDVTGGNSGTSVSYSIHAYNASGEGGAYAYAFYAPDEPCVPEGNFDISATTYGDSPSDSIKVSWYYAPTDPECPWNGFNVYRDGEYLAYVDSTQDNGTYIDSGLTSETEYCYMVTAIGEGGESGFSGTDCARTLAASVNNSPVATDSEFTIDENTSLNAQCAGYDPDQDPITFTITNGPSYGNATVNSSNGNFSYTPGTDFVGEDSFTFAVSDGEYTDTATVTLHVEAVSETPRECPSVSVTRSCPSPSTRLGVSWQWFAQTPSDYTGFRVYRREFTGCYELPPIDDSGNRELYVMFPPFMNNGTPVPIEYAIPEAYWDLIQQVTGPSVAAIPYDSNNDGSADMWQGSLTHLIPGECYRITFTYEATEEFCWFGQDSEPRAAIAARSTGAFVDNSTQSPSMAHYTASMTSMTHGGSSHSHTTHSTSTMNYPGSASRNWVLVADIPHTDAYSFLDGIDTPLSEYTPYEYQVRAYNDAGEGPACCAGIGLTEVPCEGLDTVQVDPSSMYNAQGVHVDVSGPNHHSWFWSMSPLGSIEEGDSLADWGTEVGTSNHTFIDMEPNSSPEENYTIYVAAADCCGNLCGEGLSAEFHIYNGLDNSGTSVSIDHYGLDPDNGDYSNGRYDIVTIAYTLAGDFDAVRIGLTPPPPSGDMSSWNAEVSGTSGTLALTGLLGSPTMRAIYIAGVDEDDQQAGVVIVDGITVEGGVYSASANAISGAYDNTDPNTTISIVPESGGLSRFRYSVDVALPTPSGYPEPGLDLSNWGTLVVLDAPESSTFDTDVMIASSGSHSVHVAAVDENDRQIGTGGADGTFVQPHPWTGLEVIKTTSVTPGSPPTVTIEFEGDYHHVRYSVGGCLPTLNVNQDLSHWGVALAENVNTVDVEYDYYKDLYIFAAGVDENDVLVGCPKINIFRDEDAPSPPALAMPETLDFNAIITGYTTEGVGESAQLVPNTVTVADIAGVTGFTQSGIETYFQQMYNPDDPNFSQPMILASLTENATVAAGFALSGLSFDYEASMLEGHSTITATVLSALTNDSALGLSSIAVSAGITHGFAASRLLELYAAGTIDNETYVEATTGTVIMSVADRTTEWLNEGYGVKAPFTTYFETTGSSFTTHYDNNRTTKHVGRETSDELYPTSPTADIFKGRAIPAVRPPKERFTAEPQSASVGDLIANDPAPTSIRIAGRLTLAVDFDFQPDADTAYSYFETLVAVEEATRSNLDALVASRTMRHQISPDLGNGTVLTKLQDWQNLIDEEILGQDRPAILDYIVQLAVADGIQEGLLIIPEG
jgi:hypothetical protein